MWYTRLVAWMHYESRPWWWHTVFIQQSFFVRTGGTQRLQAPKGMTNINIEFLVLIVRASVDVHDADPGCAHDFRVPGDRVAVDTKTGGLMTVPLNVAPTPVGRPWPAAIAEWKRCVAKAP